LALTTSITIRLRDEFTKKFKGMGDTARSFSSKIDKSFKSSAAIGHAADNMERFASQSRNMIRGLVSESIDLEDALARVGAKTGTTGTSAWGEMAAQARELGATTSFTALQVAQAQDFMAQAGMKSNEILAATPAMLTLSKVGALDLAEAADIATNAVQGMGYKVDQTQRVVDVLARTSVNANTNVTQLGTALAYAAPAAADAGVSVEDLSTALGVLANAGIQGSAGGTAMRAMLMRLIPTSKQAQKQMAKLGIKATDSEGKFLGFTDILGQLHDKTKDLSDAGRSKFLKQVFGERAADSVSLLLKAAGSGDWEKLAREVNNTAITSQSLADQMEGPTKKSILQLESAWSGMKDQLSQEVLPVLIDLMEEIKPMISEFSAWAKENPGLVRSLAESVVKTTALATAAGPLIRALGVLRVGIAGPQGLAAVALSAGRALSGQTGLLANLGKFGLLGAVGAVSFATGKWIAELTGLDSALANMIVGNDGPALGERAGSHASEISEVVAKAHSLGVEDLLTSYAGGIQDDEIRFKRAEEFRRMMEESAAQGGTQQDIFAALESRIADAEQRKKDDFQALLDTPIFGPLEDMIGDLRDAAVDVNLSVTTDGGASVSVKSARSRGSVNVGEIPVGAF
jgi:TP901 family phage tail tape measure protein